MKKVLIASLVVALAGYGAYCALAQYEFSTGQGAFEAKDWLTAWEHFERVGGLYRFALPSHSSEAMTWRDQSSLLVFGESMQAKGDYVSALDAYTSFMMLYPETESADMASAMIAPTMLEWAKALHEGSQYQEEIEILRKLMMDYKNTSEARQANQEIITAYDALGKHLIREKSFMLSMQAYEDAKSFVIDDETKAMVEIGYDKAIRGLATDKGAAGLQVITETLETACAGQPASSAAVGILESAQAKGMVCGNNEEFSLPHRLTPSMPGEFKYVVSIEHTDETTETCLYAPSGTLATNVLVRTRKIATVTVYSAVTGIEVEHDYFFGSAPAECPEEYAFGGTLSGSISGEEVDNAEIVSWLDMVFRK